MPKSNAQRQRDFKARVKTGEAIPLCGCGRQLRGILSRVRGICSRCWKQTDQGRAETLENVRRHREAKSKANTKKGENTND
jgi:hypothetical protein